MSDEARHMLEIAVESAMVGISLLWLMKAIADMSHLLQVIELL